jgi:hypothetical protein
MAKGASLSVSGYDLKVLKTKHHLYLEIPKKKGMKE